MTDGQILSTLSPVITLLFLGVATALASRMLQLSPVVGYILLGLALKATGKGELFQSATFTLMANMGVIFLLFDIGLHFSLGHIRKQALNIFGFGSFQVLFATICISVVSIALGLKIAPAIVIGCILSLSSTAVVGRLIAERHQQTCPVGLAATSILIFQDIAAIFFLIVATSMANGASIEKVAALAIAKGAVAFTLSVIVTKFLVGPFLKIVAASQNEEVITAVALLVALAASWATTSVGLSPTLGAFLGGLVFAETPYRAAIKAEVRPFRGILLGFFFVSIGLSIDTNVLTASFAVIVALTVALAAIKIASNYGASRVFKWSVAGSTQLGFLIAQGSEFAFVILASPTVRRLIGESRVSILVVVVALSIAITPNLANAGRSLAGRIRLRTKRKTDAELEKQAVLAPVIIFGMGPIGRTVADALIHFKIGYDSVEFQPDNFQLAIADGYNVTFGNGSDVGLWHSLGLQDRKICVLTSMNYSTHAEASAIVAESYPHLRRIAAAADETNAALLRSIGIIPIFDTSNATGLTIARAVLLDLAMDSIPVDAWMAEQINVRNVKGSLHAVA